MLPPVYWWSPYLSGNWSWFQYSLPFPVSPGRFLPVSYPELCSADISVQPEEDWISQQLPLSEELQTLLLLLFRFPGLLWSATGLYKVQMFFHYNYLYRSVWYRTHPYLFFWRSGTAWNVLYIHSVHRSLCSLPLPVFWNIQYCFPHQIWLSALQVQQLLFRFLLLPPEHLQSGSCPPDDIMSSWWIQQNHPLQPHSED